MATSFFLFELVVCQYFYLFFNK